MLLKRIDETIAQGLYDLDAGPSEEEVYVAEPSIEGNVVLWEIVAGGMIPRDLLHYDDTPDGSTKFNGSWRDFYASGASLGERPLYSGSSTFFSGGGPNFGGVAKSAIYLRYSRGFLECTAVYHFPFSRFRPESSTAAIIRNRSSTSRKSRFSTRALPAMFDCPKQRNT